jgi:hypothetical protein
MVVSTSDPINVNVHADDLNGDMMASRRRPDHSRIPPSGG